MSALEPAPTGQPAIPTMQFSIGADGNAVYKPVTGNGISSGVVDFGGGVGVGVGVGDQVKKKRGRPRKYPVDGSMSVAPLKSVSPTGEVSIPDQHMLGNLQPQQQQQQMTENRHEDQKVHVLVDGSGGGAGSGPESFSGKKRGRPPGSVNKKKDHFQDFQPKKHEEPHLDALGSPGIGFTPHVITVNTGEDVSSKIMSVSQNGPRAICILSANGTISSVTLRQAATSGGSVTYEGRFEVLSLSGSFMPSENGSRTGGLSVSLAGPDGRVIGGGVAGLLTAASPVQVVVGSFIPDGRKEPKIQIPTESMFTPSRPHSMPGQPRPSSSPSRGTRSESSGSPPNQSAAAFQSAPPGVSNSPWR